MLNLLLIISAFVLIPLGCYPLYSFLRFRLARKPVKSSAGFIEPVSIIIACYNEEKHITQKINSFLDVDEWIAGSEIIVVSTGSDDGTNAILDSFNLTEKLRVVKHPQHISKITGVNMAAALAKHEILVFSDCRQKMKKHSVKNLVHNFNDPDVGTVVAVLQNPDAAGRQSFFRSLLNNCAFWDSQVDSALNVYGALYAQRKSVFRSFPEKILFDDLYVVVSTLVQGKRLVQEPKAVIHDIAFDTYYHGHRIRRLARGLLLFLVEENKLIRQLPLPDLLRFLLFKYAKLLMPYFLLVWLLWIIRSLYLLNTQTILTVILLFSLLFVFKQIRKPLLMLLRVNYHFMMATIRFIFFKDRSVMWGKLTLKQLNQVAE